MPIAYNSRHGTKEPLLPHTMSRVGGISSDRPRIKSSALLLLASTAFLLAVACGGEATTSTTPTYTSLSRVPTRTDGVPSPSPAPTVQSPAVSVATHRIVFIESNGNVAVASESLGAQVRSLTDDGGNASPRWSPDGKSIAFVHKNPATGDTVELIYADGTSRRTAYGPVPGLTVPVWSDLDNVRWSGDGCTLYVIVSGGPSYDHHIHGQPLCGGQPTDTGIAHHFDVSSSGQFAAAWSQSATGPHIDVSAQSHPGAGNPNGATLTIADYGPVAWSPDGLRLAVLSQSHVRIYDLSGTMMASYPIDGETDSGYSQGLDWSNDGQRIIFAGSQGVTILSLDAGMSVSLFGGSEADEAE